MWIEEQNDVTRYLEITTFNGTERFAVRRIDAAIAQAYHGCTVEGKGCISDQTERTSFSSTAKAEKVP